MLRSLSLFFAVCSFAPPVFGDDALSPKALADLREASVLVKVDSQNDSGWGSGFVFKAADQKNYIVTNYHVVLPRGKAKEAPLSVLLHSGLKDEIGMSAKIIAADENLDLAVLLVEKPEKLLKAIEWTTMPIIFETQTVYTLGFPISDKGAVAKKGPAIKAAKGVISNFRTDAKTDLVSMQIDGDWNAGQSGGPVVDSQGRLIGIAQVHARESSIAFAIPPRRLLEVMSGKPGILRLDAVRSNDQNVKIRAEVQLADPLKQVKKMTLIHAPIQDAKEVLGQKKIDPARSQKVELVLVDGKATGSFEISVPNSGESLIAVQQKCENANGVESFGDPYPYVVRVRPDSVAIKIFEANEKRSGYVPHIPAPRHTKIDPEQLAKMLEDIGEGKGQKAFLAADRLGKVEPIQERRAETIKFLFTIIKQRNFDIHVRCRSIRALSFWGEDSTMEPLTKLVEDEHEWVRGEAMAALSWLGGKPQAELIAGRVFNDQDRPRVVECLNRMGSIAEPATLPVLGNANSDSRRQACVILATIGTADAVPGLQRLSRDDPEAVVRRAALEALKAIATRMESKQ